jgi:hypothetical protein
VADEECSLRHNGVRGAVHLPGPPPRAVEPALRRAEATAGVKPATNPRYYSGTYRGRAAILAVVDDTIRGPVRLALPFTPDGTQIQQTPADYGFVVSPLVCTPADRRPPPGAGG